MTIAQRNSTSAFTLGQYWGGKVPHSEASQLQMLRKELEQCSFAAGGGNGTNNLLVQRNRAVKKQGIKPLTTLPQFQSIGQPPHLLGSQKLRGCSCPVNSPEHKKKVLCPGQDHGAIVEMTRDDLFIAQVNIQVLYPGSIPGLPLGYGNRLAQTSGVHLIVGSDQGLITFSPQMRFPVNWTEVLVQLFWSTSSGNTIFTSS